MSQIHAQIDRSTDWQTPLVVCSKYIARNNAPVGNIMWCNAELQ